MPTPRPLFRMPELVASPLRPLLAVEGEKAVERAAALFPDWAIVSWAGGTNAASLTDWSPVAGRAVAVWTDNDEAGRGAAEEVAELALAARAAEVRIVTVPNGWPDRWDLGKAPPTA